MVLDAYHRLGVFRAGDIGPDGERRRSEGGCDRIGKITVTVGDDHLRALMTRRTAEGSAMTKRMIGQLACDVEGSGPPLVFITGLGGRADYWHLQVRQDRRLPALLPDKDVHCVAVTFGTGMLPEIQERLAENVAALFVDEANHTGARTWNPFKERFVGRWRVQFTATPLPLRRRAWILR